MPDWRYPRRKAPPSHQAKLDATTSPHLHRILAAVLMQAGRRVEADLEGVLAALSPAPPYR